METLTNDYYAFSNPLTIPGCRQPASFYFRFHIEKPIVRSHCPQRIRRWLPTFRKVLPPNPDKITFNEAIEELQKQRLWTTSAQQAVRDATSIITRKHALANETVTEEYKPLEIATILCQHEADDNNSETENDPKKENEEDEEKQEELTSSNNVQDTNSDREEQLARFVINK